jgi:hypothetical protein
MKLEDENYKIWFDETVNTIYFEGSIRLWDPTDYSKIKQFMLDTHELNISELFLNFVKLEFLNSSGISTLCKFILDIKKVNKVSLHIIGNNTILWQKKSFENLLKLWDKIAIEFK